MDEFKLDTAEDIKKLEALEKNESLEYRKVMLPKLIEMQLLVEKFPHKWNSCHRFLLFLKFSM